MKKKIEAELKKLAQNILDGDAEKHVDQLKQEAKVLYEKLTILQFTFSNLEEDQPKEQQAPVATVSYADDTSAPSKPQASRTQSQTTNREGNYYVPDGTEFNDSDAITEPATEKIKDIVAQMPPETEGLDRLMQAINEDWSNIKPELEEHPDPNWPTSEKTTEPEVKPEEPETPIAPEIPEEHFAEPPVFEPKEEEKSAKPEPEETPKPKQEEPKLFDEVEPEKPEESDAGDFRQIGVDYDNLPDFEPLNNKQGSNRPKSINDRLKSGISIGLNDRLAYIKHLFNGDAADYNRVLSQLNTFSDFTEAYKFIQMVVKPDYNNWEGKEQYEDRFVQVIANKFQQ
ncbi:hypothetical protein [Zunongwangia endophytica]|uniref:DUF4476 domain-containing protein n=1 Tax=Zunongwangia endophytica TaxID=1808945 RepID=A0ABV8H6U4_9FLAO|nr:hypothetical protein [Zunongwangia endophytica]MDN3596030.1 hypothetical protein [Zunongwangia endophytica]